jgi:hypothetical protein
VEALHPPAVHQEALRVQLQHPPQGWFLIGDSVAALGGLVPQFVLRGILARLLMPIILNACERIDVSTMVQDEVRCTYSSFCPAEAQMYMDFCALSVCVMGNY